MSEMSKAQQKKESETAVKTAVKAAETKDEQDRVVL